MPPERLTRAEQRARTRRALMDAAAKVFARHGYHGASLDDIATEAGFTKGAVYSNFAHKEDLYLSVLEEHMRGRLEQIQETFADTASLDDVRGGGRRVARLVDADRDLWLLFMEFWVHAAREPEVRQRFARLYDSWRGAVGEVIAARFEGLDIDLPAEPEQLAAAAIAISEGHALQRLIGPGRISDEDYGDMLAYLFAGMAAAGLDLDVDALRDAGAAVGR